MGTAKEEGHDFRKWIASVQTCGILTLPYRGGNRAGNDANKISRDTF